jgi:predicted MFS family arabinose efflux permease
VQSKPPSSVTAALLPFALIVFAGYAAVGLPLATLPLLVHGAMGFGTTTVGIVIGLAPAATLLTRQIAGRLADRHGPRLGVLLGLATAAASGLCYLLATTLPPNGALAALMAGRLVLGLGDSLFTTAIASWAVTRVGVQHAGRAMAWIGIAMYGALAIGASAGAALGDLGGFEALAIAVVVMPLLGLPIALLLADLPARESHNVSFGSVVRAIWPPGLGLVLASSGFGTIAAFLALRFAVLGWSGAGLALMAFGGVYIVVRILFAGLPDRLGGIRVATVSLVIEAAGLALIAVAGSPLMATAGTALAGLGYSLVFPALGVEAVRRVPADHRGVALGAFLACFDFGLGAAGPVMGLVAGISGLPAAFAFAGLLCLASMVLVRATRIRG